MLALPNLSQPAPIPASAAEDRKEWANRVRCRSAPDRDADLPEALRARPVLPARPDVLAELRDAPARLAGSPEALPHELGGLRALSASTEPTLFPWVAESDACRPAVDAKAMGADGPLRFPGPPRQAHLSTAPLLAPARQVRDGQVSLPPQRVPECPERAPRRPPRWQAHDRVRDRTYRGARRLHRSVCGPDRPRLRRANWSGFSSRPRPLRGAGRECVEVLPRALSPAH